MENLSEQEQNEILSYVIEKYGYAIEVLHDAVMSMVFEQDNLAFDCFVKYFKKILVIAEYAFDNGDLQIFKMDMK